MSNKLRKRVLTKLAQAQPIQPSTTTPVAPTTAPLPAIPGDLTNQLAAGYNNQHVVDLLKEVIKTLNIAMHYSSGGKNNWQKVIGNNLELSGDPTQTNVAKIAKRVYETFLNGRQAFKAKIPQTTIINWADNILSSGELSNIPATTKAGELKQKLNGKELRTIITENMADIKKQQP